MTWLEQILVLNVALCALQFLLALLNPYRPETSGADLRLADVEATELYRAGEGRMGTHEDTFIRILSSRSNAQLAATFAMYRQRYGHDFEKVSGCDDLDRQPFFCFGRAIVGRQVVRDVAQSLLWDAE